MVPSAQTTPMRQVWFGDEDEGDWFGDEDEDEDGGEWDEGQI